MEQQDLNDMQTIINAVRLAQSRGAYRLEQSESLAKNVRVITQFIQKQTAQ